VQNYAKQEAVAPRVAQVNARSSGAEAARPAEAANAQQRKNSAAVCAKPAVKPLPQEAIPKLLRVVHCSDDSVSAGVHGLYAHHSVNHGRPVFKRTTQYKGIDAFIYYWRDDEGDEFSGWWIAPSVGGEDVWVFHADAGSTVPPEAGWHAPHDGDVCKTMRVHIETPGSGTKSAKGASADAIMTASEKCSGEKSPDSTRSPGSHETKSPSESPSSVPADAVGRPAPAAAAATVTPAAASAAAPAAFVQPKEEPQEAVGQPLAEPPAAAAAASPPPRAAEPSVQVAAAMAPKSNAKSDKEEPRETKPEGPSSPSPCSDLQELQRQLRDARQEGEEHLLQLMGLQQRMELRRKKEEELLRKIHCLIMPLAVDPFPMALCAAAAACPAASTGAVAQPAAAMPRPPAAEALGGATTSNEAEASKDKVAPADVDM